MTGEKYRGIFWHVHHDVLLEWSNDIRERIAYIKREKPKNEVPTRLRLLKKVKGKLPTELAEASAKLEEASAKWDEAYAKRDEADAKLNEADAKRDEADAKLNEAYAKLKEAYAKYRPEIEKLHPTECGCKEWNGKEIVFVKKGGGK